MNKKRIAVGLITIFLCVFLNSIHFGIIEKVHAEKSGTLLDVTGEITSEESISYNFSLNHLATVSIVLTDDSFGDYILNIKNQDTGQEVFSKEDYCMYDKKEYKVELPTGNYILSLKEISSISLDYYLKVSFENIITEESPYYSISHISKTIYTGKSQTLSVNVEPSNVELSTIKWSTTNSKVATVSSKGEVKAIAKGTAIIIANIGSHKLTCNVTVKDPVYKLNEVNKILYVKDVFRLQSSVTPTSYGISGVKWSTSNSKVATVSSKGEVAAKQKGTAIITATIGTYKVSCKVTVKDMKISSTSKTIYIKKTDKLSILGGTGKITWKSSNKKVATVSSSGIVKAISTGSTVISAIRNGKTFKCTVVVKYPPETGKSINYSFSGNKASIQTKKITLSGESEITIMASNLQGNQGNSLEVAFQDEYDIAIWSKFVSPGKVAKKTLTLKAGTYYLYYDTDNKFNITIKGKTKPQLNNTSLTIGKGFSKTLKTIAVKNPVKWTSSNNKIATVDTKGVVKAKSTGTCKITCTLKDGKKLVSEIKVVSPVTAKVTYIRESPIYNDCYIKFNNNTNKKITYITLKIIQYDNRGKKVASPYKSYYVNDTIASGSSDEWYFWVNNDAKKCKVSISKVWFSDKSTWTP